MYVCPVCSSENRANANFCRKCGVRRSQSYRPDDDAGQRRCGCCSRPVRQGDRFCMSCGERLLDKAALPAKLCLSCKSSLPGKAAFCVSCGEYVGEKSSRKVQITSELFGDDDDEFTPRYEA